MSELLTIPYPWLFWPCVAGWLLLLGVWVWSRPRGDDGLTDRDRRKAAERYERTGAKAPVMGEMTRRYLDTLESMGPDDVLQERINEMRRRHRIIGEHGPEVDVPRSTGRITPRSETDEEKS